MDFHTGLVPSTRGILCISPSFWLGGSRVGNIPGNTSWYLHNTIYNDALSFSSTFSKCQIAPSGRSLSPYNIFYRNNMGLPDVFNIFSYVMWEPLIVPLGNSYCTSIILLCRFFLIHFMCTKSVTLIISLMYSVCGALRRQSRFCSCLLSAVIHNSTYAYSWLLGYILMGS